MSWLWIVIPATAVATGLLVALLSPARVRVTLDTSRSQYIVSVRLLWGVLPRMALLQLDGRNKSAGSLLSGLGEVKRLGHALLAPRFFNELIAMIGRVWKVSREHEMKLHAKAGLGPFTDRVVDAARLAIRALTPDLRPQLSVEGKFIPGIDLVGEATLLVSPLAISTAWLGFQSSAAAKEFSRRMRVK